MAIVTLMAMMVTLMVVTKLTVGSAMHALIGSRSSSCCAVELFADASATCRRAAASASDCSSCARRSASRRDDSAAASAAAARASDASRAAASARAPWPTHSARDASRLTGWSRGGVERRQSELKGDAVGD